MEQGREQGVLLIFTPEVLLLNIHVLSEFCPNSVQLQYIYRIEEWIK